MLFNMRILLIILFSIFIFSISAPASEHEKSSTPVKNSHAVDEHTTGSLHKETDHEAIHSAEPSLDIEHADHGHGHRDLGEVLPLWSCIPFACMLLSIALFPLLASEFWHHNFGKVSAFWAITLGLPFLIAYKGTALHEILHIILADYVPFIILLWSLYTVSGGILLRGTLRGTPIVNTTILIIGTILASLKKYFIKGSWSSIVLSWVKLSGVSIVNEKFWASSPASVCSISISPNGVSHAPSVMI